MSAIGPLKCGFLITLRTFGLGGILHQALASIDDVNVNLQNHLGQTLIYLAAECVHSSLWSLLADCGALVNSQCGRHGSPLHAACFCGHLQVVKDRLLHGAEVSRGSRFGTESEAACRGRQEGIAMHRLQVGVVVRDGGEYEKAIECSLDRFFQRSPETI